METNNAYILNDVFFLSRPWKTNCWVIFSFYQFENNAIIWQKSGWYIMFAWITVLFYIDDYCWQRLPVQRYMACHLRQFSYW